MNTENRIVFHVDFDYFYAQCEEIRHPELKLKPVCVCIFSDRGGDSGAIATANYEARKYGVKSGMPIAFAKRRLVERVDSVFLPADFDYYSDISEKAMNLMKEKSDIFEYVGKDEAYLDVSKRCAGNYVNASHLAQQIKNEIRARIKLSCSVGVSPNKLVSKIASDYNKPDGLTIVEPKRIDAFLGELKIRAIPGVGKKTEEAFTKMKILTMDDLRKLDVFTLNKEFGRKLGGFLYNAARGIDDEPVSEREPSIQYSKIMTLKRDSKELDFLLENLKILCSELYEIVQRNNRMFKSVEIQFIQQDLTNKTKSKMLRNPTMSRDELEKTAEQLLREGLEEQELPIRRLGVKVSELSEVRGQRDITSYF